MKKIQKNPIIFASETLIAAEFKPSKIYQDKLS